MGPYSDYTRKVEHFVFASYHPSKHIFLLLLRHQEHAARFARQLLLQAYDTLSLVKEKYEDICLEIYLLCFLSIIKLSKFHCVMKVFLI